MRPTICVASCFPIFCVRLLNVKRCTLCFCHFNLPLRAWQACMLDKQAVLAKPPLFSLSVRILSLESRREHAFYNRHSLSLLSYQFNIRPNRPKFHIIARKSTGTCSGVTSDICVGIVASSTVEKTMKRTTFRVRYFSFVNIKLAHNILFHCILLCMTQAI